MTKGGMEAVKRELKERTAGLSCEEYAAFMRELAMWATDEADIAEYADDSYSYYGDEEEEI